MHRIKGLITGISGFHTIWGTCPVVPWRDHREDNVCQPIKTLYEEIITLIIFFSKQQLLQKKSQVTSVQSAFLRLVINNTGFIFRLEKEQLDVWFQSLSCLTNITTGFNTAIGHQEVRNWNSSLTPYRLFLETCKKNWIKSSESENKHLRMEMISFFIKAETGSRRVHTQK